MARVPLEPRSTAAPAADRSVVPLTVIAGYVGAGKTTLLGHLLHNNEGERIAVVVNDLGQVVFDPARVIARAADCVSLDNGCFCCQAGRDIATALSGLETLAAQVEHVLVEAEGVAGPEEFARYARLPGYRLDGVVVVTDAEAIRSQADHPELGGDPVAQLLRGDLVVLNKADLVSRRELDAVCDWLKELIPNTRIVQASYGRLPPSLLLERERPDGMRYPSRPDGRPWRTVERHPHEIGYSTWSWVSDEPLNDAGFRWWAATLPEGVIRARGILHLRSDPGVRHVFDLIGTHWTVRPGGPWGDELPRTTIALLGRAGSFRPGWLDMTIRRCTIPPRGLPHAG
jgi:G3E family GTPase